MDAVRDLGWVPEIFHHFFRSPAPSVHFSVWVWWEESLHLATSWDSEKPADRSRGSRGRGSLGWAGSQTSFVDVGYDADKKRLKAHVADALASAVRGFVAPRLSLEVGGKRIGGPQMAVGHKSGNPKMAPW